MDERADSDVAELERIVQQRASIVADILVNVSLILNPALILLEGEVGSHPALISAVQKQLQEGEFAVAKIDAGKLGKRTIGPQGEIILGPPTTFDSSNIDNFNF